MNKIELQYQIGQIKTGFTNYKFNAITINKDCVILQIKSISEEFIPKELIDDIENRIKLSFQGVNFSIDDNCIIAIFYNN